MSASSKSLTEISFIYLIIGISGAISYYFLPISGDLQRFFAADLVMTVVTYFISVYKKIVVFTMLIGR